jgi:S-adenosylmethionine hydrolase
MLVLFTDFGWQGPYVGLLKLALARQAPTLPVIDLWHDVPPFDAQGAAYLLAAYALEFPVDAVFVGVVDPGVGSDRAGLMVQADGRWFVGPDNGLFDRVAARARQVAVWRITWQPPRLSASFHGRDLFAPVAARLAAGTATAAELGVSVPFMPRDWPEEWARVIYVDRYGNALTGIRACALGDGVLIRVAGQPLAQARTFADVAPGQGFWYENSSGLVELAVNQGSAVDRFGLAPGDAVAVFDVNGATRWAC